MKNISNVSGAPSVAVILPCYNEELAIGEVVSDFKNVLPDAVVYVFDNKSSDRTIDVARDAGAIVLCVYQKGKGNVVRRMFADIEADIFLMSDGDGTYDIQSAPRLINMLIDDGLDMVVGSRVDQGEDLNYRPGHRIGNRLLTNAVKRIFGGDFTDMLSGYRTFSRRYVKSFPALATGFEIETELTIHALELRMPYAEIETPYTARQPGSSSKLSTYRDGLRILKTILRLYMAERPLQFFSIIGFLLALTGGIISIPVFVEYFATGLVPRLPTAVLSLGMVILAFLMFVCGFILDTVTRGRHEVRRLAYLAIPRITRK